MLFSLQALLHLLTELIGPWIVRFYFLFVHIAEDRESRRLRLRRPDEPAIHPFWHSHQLAAAFHYRKLGVNILISQHADGEYIARLVQRFGFLTVRGSSTRGGGRSYKQMMGILESGGEIAITVDGPRGPRHRAKNGALYLARSTGAPLVPVAVGLSDFWEVPSWDRFRIPKPFSRGYAMLGDAIRVPPDASDEEIGRIRTGLEESLKKLEKEADERASQLHSPRRP